MNRRELKEKYKKDKEKFKNKIEVNKNLDIYLDRIDDAYSNYSGPTNFDLDSEFKEYIINRKILIEVINIYVRDGFTKEEENDLKVNIQKNFWDDLVRVKRMKFFSLIKNCIFFILGALFVFISYAVDDDKIFNEVYMVIGWFLLWEFANSLFINNPVRTMKHRHLLSIYYSQINIIKV